MRTLTKRQHEDGKGKSTISNVARVRKKTRTHEGHGGKAVKRGMPMKSVKLMKFTKPVKKKILKSVPTAQRNGKGKFATGKMATGRKKTHAHEGSHPGKSAAKSMKSMKFMKSVKKKILKDKGAIYTRTSSKTNKHGASIIRQKEAAQRAAAQQQTMIVKTVSEVISGSLPMDKRKHFENLMQDTSNKQIRNIYFESVRALSRDATVAEHMYQKSKEAHVQMVPADAPDLLVHDPTPVQTFLRRVMFAMVELEKNLIVQRLAHGRAKKHEKMEQKVKKARKANKQLSYGDITQAGKPKSCGSNSALQIVGKLSYAQKNQMKKAIDDRHNGQFGWRVLQEKFTEILGINIKSHERARRIAAEFQLHHG